MPTYEYECPECQHIFEDFQNMSEEPLTTCPSCQARGLRRLIGGGIGIIFKGSGFYANDSRSDATNHASSTKNLTASQKQSSDTGRNGNSSDKAGAETTASSNPVTKSSKQGGEKTATVSRSADG